MTSLPAASKAEREINRARIPQSKHLSLASSITPFVQRQSAPISPTDADYRDRVTSAVDFLNSGAQLYEIISNFDQSRIDTIVQSLFSIINIHEALVRDHLNNDASLLQNLRTAYTSAIRALLARAAARLNTSVFSQYTRYVDRIPLSAWPNASALGANNDAQKRTFIATVTATFSDTGIFANLGAIDQAKLEDALTKLNASVTELEAMINSQLGGDAALRQALHDSFRSAISAASFACFIYHRPERFQSLYALSLRSNPFDSRLGGSDRGKYFYPYPCRGNSRSVNR